MALLKKNLFLFTSLLTVVATLQVCGQSSPSSPSIWQESVSSSSFTVSWSQVTVSGFFTTYDVIINGTIAYNGASTSASFSAQPSTSYSVKVGARVSSYYVESSTITITTPSGPPPAIPAAPVALVASNFWSSGFVANWQATYLASSFLVDVAYDPDFQTILPNFNKASIPGGYTAMSIDGLTGGTTYYYRVWAKNQSGTSLSPSNTISALTRPSPPTSVGGTNIGLDYFTITWAWAVGADGYYLDLSTSPIFASGSYVSGYQNYAITDTHLTITDLTPHTTYYCRVWAYNNSGTSDNPSATGRIDPLDYNYVRSTVVTIPGQKTISQIETATIDQQLTKFDFIDGIGRPVQSVSMQQSPMGNDIVQPIEYDNNGRETKKYLPYTGEKNGWYKTNAVALQNSFYQQGETIAQDQNPYAEVLLQSDPLQRAKKRGSAGVAWQIDKSDQFVSSYYTNPIDHTAKFSYDTNTEHEVLLFSIDPVTSSLNEGPFAYYQPNRLHATKTKDEHNNETIEYTDLKGRVVCKKVQYGVDTNGQKLYAQTYYVYDALDRLAIVLPPEAVKALLPAQ